MDDLTSPWLPKLLQLVPDDNSRNKCIAVDTFVGGSHIFIYTAFASILLPSQKNVRCDACFRLPSTNSRLKRCSGCSSYWYCNNKCQAFHWRLNHKRICKVYNPYTSSQVFQGLQEHEQLDSILLSHVLSQMSLTDRPYSTEYHLPTVTLLDLLPHPSDEATPPPICPISPAPPSRLVSRLFARFSNNNFAIHSHLITVGHGVFPFASRLFNHSCIPNAAAKYRLSPAQSVIMEVVALRDILPGEEICIPYLDPALFQTRDNILQISYGFKCKCRSCQFIDRIQPLLKIPETVNELGAMGKQLREFVGIGSEIGSILPSKSMDGTPPPLHCVFREEYMSRLSDTFSKSAHEGQYPLALESGLTLLALYILVYPQNYPQIGIHLLEMTKTAWNAMVSSPHDARDEKLEGHMRDLLLFARQVLMVFGPEGDEVGPLREIEVLEEMLRNEQ